ncbi:expressed unknown protein [Seminavis robusta]|uniref:Uncharacterized protein n=1 Tax=Seminavis robusta TaxID=568900 RepID=A0A9N8EQ36_9STRA|nr:expressed unknown protein [Seminavis robusta]|eukprot:Sro1573_g283430.1 n/a (300) ;mRNA; f:8008-9002
MPSTDPSRRNDNESASNNCNHEDYADNETTSLTDQRQPPKKPQWFGSAVTDANQGAAGLPPYPFPPPLQNAMAHHLEKAATRRAQALDAITTDSTSSMMLIQDYLQSPLSKEGYFGFDTQEYPLREAFQTAIGLSPELELTSIHRQPPGKLHLLQYLTRHYAPFQEVYDEFVRRVCCPHLAALYDQNNTTNLDVIYYQCFPCVRMITPGEFSIGPHADISYGHHPMTTNFYVLLTDLVANESSAALFLESQMGAQDWHPIVGRYGDMVKHFAGALCAHWTTDNCTANTRSVSSWGWSRW